MSLSGEAAVYRKGDANDGAGAGAAQPEDSGGDLVAAAEAADRCRGIASVRSSSRLAAHVGDHRGLDGAGADSVDARAVAAIRAVRNL
jgi:hypothetical protein